MPYKYIVYGRRAMFADPIASVGGERQSYAAPTYAALVGISSQIYWKPSFVHVIDKVTVLNPIEYEQVGVKPRQFKVTTGDKLGKGAQPGYSTYLKKPAYLVEGHIEWSKDSRYISDHNFGKHYSMFERSLQAGGRCNPCLGTSECGAYAVPIDDYTGSCKSYYSDTKLIKLGIQYEYFSYNERGTRISTNYANVDVCQGVIDFMKCRFIRQPYTKDAFNSEKGLIV